MSFGSGGALPRVIARLAISAPFILAPLIARAQDVADVPSPSNYGGAGLLDMRTARFYPDGHIVLTTSLTQPDDRYTITVQALPWAEFSFRYSVLQEEPLYDRSFDLKIRLARESEIFPELALGFQDILGTGVYSGEYLVGSKQFGPFDVTLGLGWGRLASRGTFENPFTIFGDNFRNRGGQVSTGGVPLLKSYFRGPDMGIFGGIEYRTPIENLTFKIEYSSDAYVRERNVVGKDYSFPVNFGFTYRPLSWLDIGVSWMHGHYAGLRVSALLDPTKENWNIRLDAPPRFRARPGENAGTILQPPAATTAASDTNSVSNGSVETQFVDLTAQTDSPSDLQNAPASPATTSEPPTLPPVARTPVTPPVPVSEVQSPTAPPPAGLDPDAAQRIRAGLQDQRLDFMGLGTEGNKIVVLIENGRYRRDTEAVARAARVLSIAAPPQFEYFEVTLLRAGQPLTTVTLARAQIDRMANGIGSPAELFTGSEIGPGDFTSLDHIQPGLFPQTNAFLFPVFQQSLFDPDNPVYVRFGVGGYANLRVTRSWIIEGTAIASLYDNFNQIRRESNSGLPHVRSDIAHYLKEGKYGIDNLSTSYYFKLAPDVFGRVSAGYLEQMFAGFGGEILYRPMTQRWAIGFDLWNVRQRGFDVLFDLRHYTTFTGHLNVYYQLPWHDIQIALSGGRYLAGDVGATFQISRRFSTGVQVGAWFTLTNVSAERFGEGSFDKGIMIIIPFEWAAPFSTRSSYSLFLRPITRDGGQRLIGDATLYDMTTGANYGEFIRDWNSVFSR